jgi:lysophospholipase L1-like esterase
MSDFAVFAGIISGVVKTRLLLTLVCASASWAQSQHWVTTWATAQTLVRTPPPATATTAAQPLAAPPKQASGGGRGFNNQTIRMAVRISIGGNRLRVRISNSFGSAPLTLGAAHIALRAKDSEIVAGTDHALSFAGKPACVIGPGVVQYSDPLDMAAQPLSDLSVSLYFPGTTGPPTIHGNALHNTYVQEGDATGAVWMAEARQTTQYYWLAGIDVMAPADAATVVTLGDSITDGSWSTVESNHTWPVLLAARLASNKATANIGVANAGISGNRVLHDGSGSSALARFDRDVLSQPGVKWVMLLEGINDIGVGTTTPAEPVTADELIAGYQQIIAMAHAHRLKIIGCTLTPYEGANYYNENGEAIRAALNQWIRTSGAYDAVVDFDAATRDAAKPKNFRDGLHPGDHLHPNNAGYEAMANSVDLAIFSATPATPASKKK